MDVWWWSSWLLPPVILLFVARWLWQLYMSQGDPASALPMPPGDMGWPFIGEMLDFIYQAFTGGDFFLNRRDRYGPVFKTHVLGKPTVRVAGKVSVKSVLLGEHTYVRGQWPDTLRTLVGASYNLSMAQGDVHKQRRKMVLRAFSQSALEGYAEPLQRLLAEELERWCGRGRVLVYEEARLLVLRASLEILIGFSEAPSVHSAEITKHLGIWTEGFFSAGWCIPGTAFYRAVQSRKHLIRLLQKQIAMKRTNQHFRSALSLIRDSQEDGGHVVGEEEVLEIMLELLVAGQFTVRSAITSTVMLLGQHPEIVTKIMDELDSQEVYLDRGSSLSLDTINQLTYVNDVVREILRLSPPVGGGFRTVLRTMEVQGYQIPKGWTILYAIKDSHDSSPLYKEPYSFNPDRWKELSQDGSLPSCLFLSFGAGARSCVGKEFGKLLLRILIVTLVRMCEWKLTSEKVVMKRFPNAHPADGLPTLFTRLCDEDKSDSSGHSRENNVRHRHNTDTDT